MGTEAIVILMQVNTFKLTPKAYDDEHVEKTCKKTYANLLKKN